MSLKSMVGISLLILIIPAASWGWQPQPAAQQPGAPPPPYSAPAPDRSLMGAPQEYRPSAPASPGYQVPQAQGNSSMNQPGYPQYPYPPYHNPYFGGYSARNFVSNTIDWIIALPSNILDRFSNYLDRTVFPRMPATNGGSVQRDTSVPVKPQRTSPTEPLPPAAVYTPGEQ